MNNYMELDTPALVVDRKGMEENMRRMQDYADRHHVNLRPHTKNIRHQNWRLSSRNLDVKELRLQKLAKQK